MKTDDGHWFMVIDNLEGAMAVAERHCREHNRTTYVLLGLAIFDPEVHSSKSYADALAIDAFTWEPREPTEEKVEEEVNDGEI